MTLVFIKKPAHNIYLRDLHSYPKTPHRFLSFPFSFPFREVSTELSSSLTLLEFASDLLIYVWTLFTTMIGEFFC